MTDIHAPVPVLGWDAPRHEWLKTRLNGIGASDVAALLGLIPRWCTPYELWAIKKGHISGDHRGDTPPAKLGRLLEPFLIEIAPELLGMGVARTPHQLYCHWNWEWAQCSPDAFAEDGGIVETKTGKLASYGDPAGWEDGGIPLAHELQGRWQMFVMGRPRVHFVGLVAPYGLITRTLERHIPTELDLFSQVGVWREKYILADAEPPVDGFDLEALAARYRQPDPKASIELGEPLAYEWLLQYRAAAAMESAGKAAKKDPKAKLTALLGNHTVGLIDGNPTCTWNPVKGDIDWQRMARDLAEAAGVEIPDPELYRKPSGRQFRAKV